MPLQREWTGCLEMLHTLSVWAGHRRKRWHLRGCLFIGFYLWYFPAESIHRCENSRMNTLNARVRSRRTEASLGAEREHFDKKQVISWGIQSHMMIKSCVRSGCAAFPYMCLWVWVCGGSESEYSPHRPQFHLTASLTEEYPPKCLIPGSKLFQSLSSVYLLFFHTFIPH